MESSWDRFGRTKASLWRDYGASPVVSPDYVAYTYDYAGNRTKRSPRAASPGSHYQSFEYDGLHRLQKMTTPASFAADGLTQEWTLDQLGNWTTFKHDLDADGDYSDPGDLNQTRTHNAVNEIGTISGWFNPAHDAAGNMTTIPSPHATSGAFSPLYDAWNRMVHVDNNTSAAQTNEYDGLNRRIVRDEGGEVRHFYYNQQWQVVEERVGSAATADKQYIYHSHYVDAIAMRIDSSGDEHYYLQDANFNVTAVVESDGDVAERYDYTPYGEVTVLEANYTADPDNQSDIANEYLYTGRRLDPETGLQLNRNRFYASHLGRWVNRDPIACRGGTWNLYEYVGSMPTFYLDANGLEFGINPPPEFDPGDGYDPGSNVDQCDKLAKTIQNLIKSIQKRIEDMKNDPLGLPGTHPNDKKKPRLSRRGHMDLINIDKARLALLMAMFDALCRPKPKPEPEPAPATCPVPCTGHACVGAPNVPLQGGPPPGPFLPPLRPPTCREVAVGVGVTVLICTPWPDDVLIPPLLVPAL